LLVDRSCTWRRLCTQNCLANQHDRLYSVRYLLTSWYNYRTSNAQEYLDSLYKERDATLEKLKLATKYNTTQQLLEKYGKVRPQPSKESPKNEKPKKRASEARVFTSPPPTANIPRNQHIQSSPPQQLPPSAPSSPSPNPALRSPFPPPTEDFAPNAFDYPQQPAAPPVFGPPKWYDRILDALIGDDETLAKNRFALICSECRLVNGLAPPGAKTLEEVGKWKCSGCGTLNGRESVTEKLLKEVDAQKSTGVPKPAPESDSKTKKAPLEERQGSDDDSVAT
jgi:endoplasmic reticulum junction formation protein lunapark